MNQQFGREAQGHLVQPQFFAQGRTRTHNPESIMLLLREKQIFPIALFFGVKLAFCKALRGGKDCRFASEMCVKEKKRRNQHFWAPRWLFSEKPGRFCSCCCRSAVNRRHLPFALPPPRPPSLPMHHSAAMCPFRAHGTRPPLSPGSPHIGTLTQLLGGGGGLVSYALRHLSLSLHCPPP